MPPEGVYGQFVGLPYPVLVQLQTAYSQAAIDVATAGQSHAVTGRSFTFAQLPEIRRTLAELAAAIAQANGTRIRRTRAYGGGYTR